MMASPRPIRSSANVLVGLDRTRYAANPCWSQPMGFRTPTRRMVDVQRLRQTGDSCVSHPSWHETRQARRTSTADGTSCL